LSQPDTANPNKAVSAMTTEVIRFIVVIAGSLITRIPVAELVKNSGALV
jgi:hypothetical protein